MERIATWSKDDRADLVREASAIRKLAPEIVEKDFWVCWSLSRLFGSPAMADKILFKGGTSLSKVFGLIERFSEDVDLILDWREITGEDPAADRSATGQSRLAPHISPNKTYEGLIGGMLCSVLATTLVLFKFPGIHPWQTEMMDALSLAVVVAVVAPIGDLAQSLIKRDLGVKDMGSLLPGHGGVFDRFDGLLLVLPAAYYVSDLVLT